ncbi:hypothetical protein B0I35DRAFT_484195 [Stachybotrys elegans]|uniref:CFEM domain-containing protein n=1 Tax=Stachybotrys elegans TaxID=80388 RepID=A0A8K0SFT3_9HYPO|nr:hypothetical protein B0I35DRAFT_484195 [Stachybotrys elegans]
MKATFIALAAAASLSQVSATFGGFHNAPPFACPGNSDNVCEEKQKGGWNWGDLTPGKFNNYDGFNFNGWTCEDKFSKRDVLAPRTFGKKVIAGRCGPEPSKAPSFECGPTKKKFSVKKFELDVEFDCRLEFHYDMPDGSVCKHAQECKAGGNVVHNTQCGGAKKVRFVYPPHPGKPKECNIGVGPIDFDCDNNTPPKPPYNPGKPPHNPGKPPHHPGKPSTSSPVAPPPVTESSALPVESTTVSVPEESTTVPVPEESTTTPAPEESTTVSVPGESTVPAESTTASVPGESTVPAESTTVSVPGESTIPTPEESTTVPVPEESTTVPPAGETTTTEPVFITSSIPAGSSTVPVPEESTTVSVPGESTVPAPEESTPVVSVPGESTVPAPAESTSTAPGSETTESSALPVESTTLEVSTPPAVPTTLTTVYDTTSTVFTTSVQTITSCGPEVPDCPAKGTTAIVTVTIPVSTTICPVTETITTVPGVPTETAPAPVSPPVDTPVTPPQTPEQPDEDLPCPAVVPKCLNTFFYLVDSCRDNTDAQCYCPNKDYVDEVFKCLYAHGESGDIIAEAVNFFQGICADKIPENPAIITGADDITQHITITGTPVVPTAVYTTVIVDATVTAPAVVDGTTIVGSSTTVVISTEVTVPQVTLPTAAATEPAAGVPDVPAVPTLITSRPVLTGTGGLPIPSSPVVPINGASSVRGGMAIGAIVMAVLAAF